MVVETVTIQRDFTSSGGSGVLVVIDQSANSIRVYFRPEGGANTEIALTDLSDLAEMFQRVAELVPPQNLESNSQTVLSQAE